MLTKDLSWAKPVASLRLEVSRISFLYHSVTVSNQQHAIELYELNQKHMGINEVFNKLQDELDNLHEFLNQVNSEKLNEMATKLTLYAIPLAAGGLVAGVFGMNDFHLLSCTDNCTPWWDIIFEAATVLVVAVAVGFCLSKKGAGLCSWIKGDKK